MHVPQKLKDELKDLTLAMLYFGSWITALILLKQLVLAEYEIAFNGLSLVLIGTLILSKVVLILEHVPLGRWVESKPAWVDVILRTILYSFGVLVVMILEKGIEGRSENGGFFGAVSATAESSTAAHIVVNSACISAALLFFNVLTVIRLHLGEGALLKLFLVPLPKALPSKPGPTERDSA